MVANGQKIRRKRMPQGTAQSEWKFFERGAPIREGDPQRDSLREDVPSSKKIWFDLV
jgi:hypothetical protein